MNLMPLANLLEAEGIGLKGSSIFINMLPAGVEQAVLLRSPLSGTPINYELPGYYSARFHVIVRTPAADYAGGAALMQRVLDALTFERRQVESMFFNHSRPQTKPVTFPLSAGNLLELSVTFDVNFVEGA